MVVTGLGVVSGAGSTVERFWQNVTGGSSGAATITAVDPAMLGRTMAVEVPDGELGPLGALASSSMDRFAMFAMLAGAQAVTSAQLPDDVPWGERSAACTGTSVGGQSTQDRSFKELYGKATARVHPLTLPRAMSNAGAAHLSIRYGITGPTLTFATACAASNYAIGHAFWMLRMGVIDRAIAGGSEAPFSYGNLKAWEALHALDPRSCRPFSADRGGTILGEGAGMLVLETLEAAQQRNASIHAEIVGFGMTSDAHHLTQPSSDGAARAMRAALADASLPPSEIGYINAHGTGTHANDKSEAEAIRSVFGAASHVPAVSSTKAVHGHGQGATGGFEAIATILALRDSCLPPTANVLGAAADCPIDLIVGAARRTSAHSALSNTFAFGGMNAVLAFSRWNRQ